MFTTYSLLVMIVLTSSGGGSVITHKFPSEISCKTFVSHVRSSRHVQVKMAECQPNKTTRLDQSEKEGE